MDITIPNLGDIDEVEVIEINVAVGDVVEVNDTLIVIESDKASMDVPSTHAGVIEALHVALGDNVAEGDRIVTVKADDDAVAEAPAAAEETVEATAPEPPPEPAAPAAPAAPALAAASEVREVMVPDIGEATGVVVIEVAVAPGASRPITERQCPERPQARSPVSMTVGTK